MDEIEKIIANLSTAATSNEVYFRHDIDKEDNGIVLPTLTKLFVEYNETLRTNLDLLSTKDIHFITLEYATTMCKDVEMLMDKYKTAILNSTKDRLNRLQAILETKIGARVSFVKVDSRYQKNDLFNFLQNVGINSDGYEFYSYRQLVQALNEITAIRDRLRAYHRICRHCTRCVHLHDDFNEYYTLKVSKLIEQLGRDVVLTFKKLSVFGARGFDGRKGAKGFPGVKGHSGTAGAPGALGEKGDKGVRGQKGEKGKKGSITWTETNAQLSESNTHYFNDVNCEEQAMEGKWIVYPKPLLGEKGLKGNKGRKGDRGVKGKLGWKGEKGSLTRITIEGNRAEKGEKGNSHCDQIFSPKINEYVSVDDKFWFGPYRLRLRRRVLLDQIFLKLKRMIPKLKQQADILSCDNYNFLCSDN